jgi:hypothetical protein
MSPNAKGVMLSLIALTILGMGCRQQQEVSPLSDAESAVAGTYVCAPEPPPDDPNWPGPEDFALKEDRSLEIGRAGKVNLRGTWSVDGDQVVLQIEGQGTDRFDVDGDRLISAGGEPPPPGEDPALEPKFICNKKSS